MDNALDIIYVNYQQKQYVMMFLMPACLVMQERIWWLPRREVCLLYPTTH